MEEKKGAKRKKSGCRELTVTLPPEFIFYAWKALMDEDAKQGGEWHTCSIHLAT
jgi:hypothetical protein